MKTKNILALAIIMMSLAVKSQDKYEYAIIAYFPNPKFITIAIEGKEVIKEDVDAEKYERVSGSPILKKVNEYQEKGWEVMTFNNAAAGQYGLQEFYAYLRKKKTS